MELVYLYVQAAHGEEYDLHLDFSQDIKVRFDKDTKEFFVEKLSNKYLSSFFGKNIKNVTGLVGPNGIGKTTLLKVLACEERSENDSWKYIILYRNIEEYYYLEGNIEGIDAKKIGSSFSDFFYQGNIIADKFVPRYSATDSEERTGLFFLKLDTVQKKNRDVGFERRYSNVVRDINIFNLLTSYGFKKVFHFREDNKCELSFNNERIYSTLIGLTELTVFYEYLQTTPSDKNDDNDKCLEMIKCLWGQDINKPTFQTLKDEFIYSLKREYFDRIRKYLAAFIYRFMRLDKDTSSRMDEDQKSQHSADIRFLYRKLIVLNGISFSDSYFYDMTIQFFSCSRIREIVKRHADYDYIGLGFLKKRSDFEKIIENLRKVEEDYFKYNSDFANNKVCIRINIDTICSSQKNIFKEIIDSKDSFPYVLSCNFQVFSSGEEKILNSFAQLNSELQSIVDHKTCVLLLDEYELHLHPEWSRKYLFFLLKYLESYEKLLFQVVLVTHFPYLISDLPKENIRLIEKDKDTGKRKVSKPKHSFASNYYDILSDSFFLDDTIGEFAKQKINSWITELNKLKKNKLKIFLDDDQQKIRKVNEIKELISLDVSNKVFIGSVHKKLLRIAEIKELINIVDDLFIRNKLLELAEDVRAHILKKPENSKISRIKQIDQEIERLEAMKKQLREESEK